MIFLRIDECVSYKVAEAAKAVGIQQGLIIETPHARSEKGIKDEDWLSTFARRGTATDAKAVFSSDGAIRDNEPERAAAEDAGVILFFAPYPKWWRPLGRMGQAAYFLRWLPTLAEIAQHARPGAQYKLPGTFTPRSDLRPLPPVIGRKVVRPGRPKAQKPASGGLFASAGPSK